MKSRRPVRRQRGENLAPDRCRVLLMMWIHCRIVIQPPGDFGTRGCGKIGREMQRDPEPSPA
jgi:hypothetical protein